MDEDGIEAFLALRDLVVRLQSEQVDALRSMQAALTKLAGNAAEAAARIEALERRVDALYAAQMDVDDQRTLN